MQKKKKNSNPIMSIKKNQRSYIQGVLNEFAHLEIKYNGRLQNEIPHKYINLNKYMYIYKPDE